MGTMRNKIFFLSIFGILLIGMLGMTSATNLWYSGLNNSLTNAWTLNQSTGASVIDNFAGVNLGFAGSPNWVSWIGNNFQNKYALNTTTSNYATGAVAIPNSDQYSFSIWFNPQYTVNKTMIVENTTSSGVFNIYYAKKEDKICGQTGGNPDRWTCGTANMYNNGSWNNIFWSCSAGFGSCSIYVNGHGIAGLNFDGATTTAIRLGRVVDGDTKNSSMISDAYVWSRQLNTTEQADLANYTFYLPFGQTSPLQINLNNPINYMNQSSKSVYFNCSGSNPVNVIKNVTLIIDGASNFTKTGTTNYTELSTTINNIQNGLHNWSCSLWDNTSTQLNSSVRYFNISLFKENYQVFTNPTTSNAMENFRINLSYSSTFYGSITANLIYNGTSYNGIKAGTGDNIEFSKSINVPIVTSQNNYSFYWAFTLGGLTPLNSTVYSQTINQINLDDCSVYTKNMFNLTLYDEINQQILSGTINAYITLYDPASGNLLINFSKQYLNKPSALICIQNITTNYNEYARFEYTIPSANYNSSYVIRNYYLDNFQLNSSSLYQNISLFNLNSSIATPFLIGYKDPTYLSVANALINIQKEYVQEGVFKTVEIEKTDSNGQATGYFDLGSGVYTIVVTQNGVLLSSFPHVAVSCQQNVEKCQINLFAATSGQNVVDFNNYNNLRYQITFNDATGLIDVTFSSIDGSSNIVLLNVINFDGYNNNSLCSSSVASSSGEVFCSVNVNNNVTAIANLYMNNRLITSRLITVWSAANIFNGNILVYVLVLMLTIPMMFIPSAIGVILGLVFGLVCIILIFGLGGATIIGAGSTIMWVIISAIILIWKISQRGGSE